MTTETTTAMLRGALAPTLGVGALGVLVAGLVVGTAGAVGAGIALVVVVAFFAAGLLVLGACARGAPEFMLLVALGLYVAKVVALGVTFWSMQASGVLHSAVDRTALGLCIVACTLAWTVGELVAAARSRQPIYDLGTGETP